MLKILIVGLGGFLGAIARYGLQGLVHRYSTASFPTGTLVVNLLGCAAIGVFMCLAEERQFFSASTRLFLTVGFLSSFTTLSTVGYETFHFLRGSDFRLALLNAGANMILGLMAVAFGWTAVNLLRL